MAGLERNEFVKLVSEQSDDGRTLAVPLVVRLLSDQLTPVLAYRRLVAADQRTAPSFLLESVEGGERQGRYSILGAQPVLEVVATGAGHGAAQVSISGPSTEAIVVPEAARSRANPLASLRDISGGIRLVLPRPRGRSGALPAAFLGGWSGYAAYDTVRFAEPAKLGRPPHDDRGLNDLCFALYDGSVVFDHADKHVCVVQLALVRDRARAGDAYDQALARLEARAVEIQRHSKPLTAGRIGPEGARPALPSNLSREQHAAMVSRAKEHIRAGDIFQVVVGQRFERTSATDPFDVYRALRAVNPSPYMVYLQAPGCILIASSPEILCRVRRENEALVVTNRPLAGTRRRGKTLEEDLALERELLADQKERAEHIMLVDLGRNDVGRVAKPGTVKLPALMEVERYSHVMHISSTVTGELREGLDCWDALGAALPVGTISGAPKVRAMQIIDDLEPVKRGPYGGGMGCVGLDGQMDIALALRTIVTPTARYDGKSWTYHLQAAGGIVADSDAEAEYMETVNKAAALARAIDLAEQAFGK